MISIGKKLFLTRKITNHYKALVAMAALAIVLIVNTVAIGTDGHIALARHYDNTKVFENSHINIKTDRITQDGPPSPCTTTTMHPTVLTLKPISTNGDEVL